MTLLHYWKKLTETVYSAIPLYPQSVSKVFHPVSEMRLQYCDFFCVWHTSRIFSCFDDRSLFRLAWLSLLHNSNRLDIAEHVVGHLSCLFLIFVVPLLFLHQLLQLLSYSGRFVFRFGLFVGYVSDSASLEWIPELYPHFIYTDCFSLVRTCTWWWWTLSAAPECHVHSGERGGSVVECRTPERPTAAVLCPWARHFTPRKYWLITQEAMAPSRHD